jgi:hypothetical protein
MWQEHERNAEGARDNGVPLICQVNNLDRFELEYCNEDGCLQKCPYPKIIAHWQSNFSLHSTTSVPKNFTIRQFSHSSFDLFVASSEVMAFPLYFERC